MLDCKSCKFYKVHPHMLKDGKPISDCGRGEVPGAFCGGEQEVLIEGHGLLPTFYDWHKVKRDAFPLLPGWSRVIARNGFSQIGNMPFAEPGGYKGLPTPSGVGKMRLEKEDNEGSEVVREKMVAGGDSSRDASASSLYCGSYNTE